MQKQIMIRKELEQKHVHSITKMCKGNELLTYIFFTSVADILLHKMYDKELVKILSPRYMPETEEEKKQLVFIEKTINSNDTFRKFINEVKNATVNSYKRQSFINYDKQSKTELFKKKNVVFGYAPIHKSGVEHIMEEIMQNELIVYMESTTASIAFSIYFNEESYQREAIEHVFSSYCYMIEQILTNMDVVIDDIDMVNPEEKEIITKKYSQTSSQKNIFKNIIEMYDESVKNYPDHIAVSYENSEVSYKELECRVNRVCIEIEKFRLEHNSVIGVIADYSVEMVVAVLAVLKSGNAYLPIDVDCPQQRKEYMIQDSGAKAVILASVKETCDLNNVKILNLSTISEGDEDREFCVSEINESDLAYIIYTSGTMGKPKKVEIEHHSVVNLFSYRNKEYGITREDKILQLLSFEFDGFGTNLYSALLSGAQLVLPASEKKGDFAYINDLIDKKKVTNMSLVPSLMSAVLMNRNSEVQSLKSVILAGEKSNNKVMELAKRWTKDTLYINEYGPTENCIVTTFWKNYDKENSTIIGKPIQNVRVYILNKKMQVLPVGAWGELFIAGEGLARKADESQEGKGIKTVASPGLGEKLYPTGDYVRWVDNGLIEFKGRMDQQIKIRGYRVELSEIERAISELGGIDDCAVICKTDNDGNKLLCAFVVSSKISDMTELRKKLALCVPDYMLPARFIHMDTLPLTSNGKVSKEKLLEIYEKQYMNRTIIAPKNAIEEKLLAIWTSVLNNNQISTKDSFFEVGGNSLLLTQILSKIEEQLGASLNVTDLFAHPTIYELAKKIESNDKNNLPLTKMKYTGLQKDCFVVMNAQEKTKKYTMDFEEESTLSIKEFCEKNEIGVEKYFSMCLFFAISKISDDDRIHFYVDSNGENELLEYGVKVSEYPLLQDCLEAFKDNEMQNYYRLKCEKEKNEASFLLIAYSNLQINSSIVDMFDAVVSYKWSENILGIEFYLKNNLSVSTHQTLIQLFAKLVNGFKDFYK